MDIPVKVAIQDYMSTIFFGEDRKRIVYSEPAYAFRARTEQLAQGIKEGDTVFINNLQLPFGSFYLTTQPEIIKSVSASEWAGYYDRDLEYYLHFWNFTRKCKVQLWFSRLDEMEVARKIAMAEQHSKAPARYIESVYWRGKTLQLPVWITVDKLTYGQEAFTNSEWLKQSQLWPMTLELIIESAEIHINKGLKAVQLPFKWHNTGNVDEWVDGEKEYFTQKSVLAFAHDVYNAQLLPPKEITADMRANISAMTYIPYEDIDDETARGIAEVIPNRNICEMVKGTFKESTLVKFSKLLYNDAKTKVDPETGKVTAWIDTIVHKSTYQYWKGCRVVVPSHPDMELKTCKTQSLQIPDLYPNSHYTIYFITEDTGGNFNTVPLEFTTPIWEKETLAVMDGTVESINNRVNTEPKDVPLNGLMNLENEWTDGFSGLEM